jgi:hypothetical protein
MKFSLSLKNCPYNAPQGDDPGTGGYPTVIFAYVPLDKVHKSADLARIQVDPSFNSWQLQSDLSLPENASQIVSISPAVLPVGSGIFILYEIQSKIPAASGL